jgi:hypothetical protein
MKTTKLFRGWMALAMALGLPAATNARGDVRHVIAISIDGARGDFLRTFIETAPADFPNFTRLRNLSASTFNARCDYTDSVTIPNHLCMLTGRPVRRPEGSAAGVQHGVVSDAPDLVETVHNSGLAAGSYKASIFDVVHDRGLGTALYMGKGRLRICGHSWDKANGAVDRVGADDGRNKIDVGIVTEAAEGSATEAMVGHLVGTIEGSTLKTFTIFHIADTDYAGHGAGWSTALGGAYRNGMRAADGWLGRILDAVQNNPALAGKVAILLTADRGGGAPETGHTDATNLSNVTIPFFLLAPGIAGGSDLYDYFENRFEAGATRPSYTAARQPMRNGDVANLSAALLGLPSVPGSLMVPQLKPRSGAR